MTLAVTEYDELDDDIGAEAWDLYEATFIGINEMAAQRHLMTVDEFYAVARDKRIRKFIACDNAGMVGLSTITNDLAAWSLVAPEYFERAYPDQYARKAIWYIGLVGARSAAPSGTFRALIAAMYPQVAASRGIFVQDFCEANVKKGLPRAMQAVVGALDPGTWTRQVDTQTFWVGGFE